MKGLRKMVTAVGWLVFAVAMGFALQVGDQLAWFAFDEIKNACGIPLG